MFPKSLNFLSLLLLLLDCTVAFDLSSTGISSIFAPLFKRHLVSSTLNLVVEKTTQVFRFIGVGSPDQFSPEPTFYEATTVPKILIQTYASNNVYLSRNPPPTLLTFPNPLKDTVLLYPVFVGNWTCGPKGCGRVRDGDRDDDDRHRHHLQRRQTRGKGGLSNSINVNTGSSKGWLPPWLNNAQNSVSTTTLPSTTSNIARASNSGQRNPFSAQTNTPSAKIQNKIISANVGFTAQTSASLATSQNGAISPKDGKIERQHDHGSRKRGNNRKRHDRDYKQDCPSNITMKFLDDLAESNYFDRLVDFGAATDIDVLNATYYRPAPGNIYTDSDICAFAHNSLRDAGITLQEGSIALVFTDETVNVNGLGDQHCGWSGYCSMYSPAFTVVYGGLATQYPNSCLTTLQSPEPALWALNSALSHIAASLANAILNSLSANLTPVSTFCQWRFGTVYTNTRPGGCPFIYNFKEIYLVQELSLSNGTCSSPYNTSATVP